MHLPTVFASTRAKQQESYEREMASLQAELSRRVQQLASEKSEFNPGAFPPEWKVRRWKAEEAFIRRITAVVDLCDLTIRFERTTYDAALLRVEFLTEAGDADKAALLASNNWLQHEVKMARASEADAFRSTAAESAATLLWMVRCRDLMKQLKAAGLTPNLIHSTDLPADNV